MEVTPTFQRVFTLMHLNSPSLFGFILNRWELGQESLILAMDLQIVLSQDSSSNLCPAFQIFRGTSVPAPKAQSLTALVLSRWQFLTATFDGSRMSIYINGVLTGSTSLVYSLSSFIRTNNYVGKSFNSPPSGTRTDGYSYSYLDDLRFYNKSLNQSEILKIMSLNSMIFFLLSF